MRQRDDIDALWHLADELTVEQAAALVAGYDPGLVSAQRNSAEFASSFPKQYPAQTALVNAINGGGLPATQRFSAREYGYEDWRMDDNESYDEYVVKGSSAEDGERLSKDGTYFYKPFSDWTLSTIRRDDLITWLKSKGYTSGFLFAERASEGDYMNPSHSRFAPKLAAAVLAWQAVTEPNGKSVKQALEAWLKQRAPELNLAKGGIAIETAIQECAKVANWQPAGGSPKTPGL